MIQKRDWVEPGDGRRLWLTSALDKSYKSEYLMCGNFIWKLVRNLGSSSRMSQENWRSMVGLCDVGMHNVEGSQALKA